jgi:histone-lysine N-methyltransferase SETD2
LALPVEEVSPARLATVACGEGANCINRTLFIECRPGDCPCGERCQNQRFQRAQHKDIEVMRAPGKGHGLRTRVGLEPYGVRSGVSMCG